MSRSTPGALEEGAPGRGQPHCRCYARHVHPLEGPREAHLDKGKPAARLGRKAKGLSETA